MDKIKPLIYIQDSTPALEIPMDASGWFATEYIELTAKWDYGVNAAHGPDTGNYLPWFLAQGWIVYDTQETDIGPSGGVYQYNYKLKRRKLQSERVLKDMISEFTSAYNEGRSINDQRYDEIVTIFSVMLDKTETESVKIGNAGYNFCSQIEALMLQFEPDFNLFKAEVDGVLDDYGTSRIADINAQFDNELAKARQGLIERGLNNTTAWASVSVGIERERARALSDANDKIAERKLGVSAKVYEARESFRNRTVTAYERLMVLKRENLFTPLKLRNDILSAMLAFMERRTDDYPGLDGLANLAAQLGYSEGAAIVAPTT